MTLRLRLKIWVMNMTVVFMIRIGRRAVVLWALTIVMLRRAVTRELNSGLLGRAVRVRGPRGVMTKMVGRANVLLGVVMVGRAIVLWGWTTMLLGMTVITVRILSTSVTVDWRIKGIHRLSRI
jgi:hypothetical protein